jgi:hypothetical protein
MINLEEVKNRFIANWLFEKAEILTHILFSRTNANIEEHLFLWTIIGIIIIVLALKLFFQVMQSFTFWHTLNCVS